MSVCEARMPWWTSVQETPLVSDGARAALASLRRARGQPPTQATGRREGAQSQQPVDSLGRLSLRLGVLATADAVVFVRCRSDPLILRGLAPSLASLAQRHEDVWRRDNTVLGCLGVGGILYATAPLRDGGLLVSVPLITVWGTLGSPLRIQTLRLSRGTAGAAVPSHMR